MINCAVFIHKKNIEKKGCVINHSIDLLVLALLRDQSVYISTHRRSSWHQ